jgi:amino acid transporter
MSKSEVTHEPTLAMKFRYRLGGAIPERFKPWVERDVAQPAFFLWNSLYLMLGVIIAALFLDQVLADYDPIPAMIGTAVGGTLASVFRRHRIRRKWLESQERRWAKLRAKERPSRP